MVADPVAVQVLFAPAPVQFQERDEVVVWTARSDTFASQIAATSIGRLLERFRRCPSRWQNFVLADPLEDRELVESLSRLGSMHSPYDPGQPFLAEVERPDGVSVVGFVAGSDEDRPRVGGGEGLIRAPRLRARLLAATEDSSARSWRLLLQELLPRQHPLLFIVHQDSHVFTMKWPGFDGALPVFADLRSLLRAATELQKQPGTYRVGALPGPQLYAYAHERCLPVAMNVYPDEGPVRYLVLTLDTLEALASGRLPDQ